MLVYLTQLLQQLVCYFPWKTPSLLNHSDLLHHYHNATARLFLFDWDGTLTPIVREPAAAVPTPVVVDILQKLSSHPKNEFWIISGRDSSFLGKHFDPISSIGLSAEHGAFVRYPRHADWEGASGPADKAWQDDAMAIFQEITDKATGSVIERKNVSITWHYRNAVPKEGALHAEECRRRLKEEIIQSHPDLEVIDGKMCLEIRPRTVNKGAIVQSIIANFNKKEKEQISPDFVLCMGDDVTDEGWFKSFEKKALGLKHGQICFKLSKDPKFRQIRSSPCL
ncbi:MAG: hypothetical protein L6R41_006475 [Letrouitia leprolyta]|nr:MAG: hypothetical protein L6R41_006475 [Letrouitia leprolyta]